MLGSIMPPGMDWQQAMAVSLQTPSLQLILCRSGLRLNHYKFNCLPLAVLLSLSHSQHKTAFRQRGLSTLFFGEGRGDQLWHRNLRESLWGRMP